MPADIKALTAAVVALARANIPTDIQELLVAGNPMKGIAPGALAAAIASYEAARETGWRSMDSAPKDGTEFQAWIGEYGWEPKCRINPESEAFEIWGRVDYDQENWDVYSHLTPTHWQPNPAAPLPEQEPRP